MSLNKKQLKEIYNKMIKEQLPPIKLTLRVHGEKYQAIIPWNDDLETIFYAFTGLLINAGYKPEEVRSEISNLYWKQKFAGQDAPKSKKKKK